MKKKGLLLIISVFILILISCGKNQEIEDLRSNGSYNPNIKLEGNLITKNPLDLDIHLHFRNMYHYDEEWPVAKEAAKLTNIRLHSTATTSGLNSSEVFEIMMLSGKIPDIVGGNKKMDDFIKYGLEGQFIPLNDLIDEYAPNIKKFLDENPKIRQGIKAPDGNIYFIPYVQDGKVARGYWIRQDWLDNLGLQAPDTVDELYDTLVAFRDDDPNENGKNDTIPMIFSHWEEVIRLTTLWGARTAGTDTYISFYKTQDEKIAHGWVEPAFKVGLKNVIKWYNEGLIDPEVFTRGTRSREVLFSSNQGGMTRDWMASTSQFNSILKDEVPGFNIQPILPPIGTTGERIEENQRAILKPDGWAITSKNKSPIETIMYFDFFFTEEGRRLANFGVEGEHYEIVDGKPVYKSEILNNNEAVNQQMWKIGAQISIGFQMDYEYEKQWTDDIAQKGIEMYEKDVKYFEDFIVPTLTLEERQIYNSRWPSIHSYMEETIQRWILNNADIDKEWDKYVNTLKRLGLNEVIEVYQDALARQKRNI